jgi:rRNA maturation endonuclease Nob1
MKKDICRWTHDDYHGAWDTECDEKHVFIDGTPSENKHHFCPYCGGRLRVLAREERRVKRNAD